ncbi:MAG: hypothetical protein KatS3mg046_604 [Bellilinea sp.]|nr:MAG: hypothetical protein KatS3mg046_604 [Bellilinea sp.]
MKNVSRYSGYKVNHLVLWLVAVVLWSCFISPANVRADDSVLPVVGEPVAVDETSEPHNSIQFTGCERQNFEPVNMDFEQRVVELVNEERNKQNLPPLKWNLDLGYAARYHARDMAEDGYFNHDSYDGRQMICSWSTRIGKFYSGWSSLAENIAAGYTTPENVISGWMNSSGHRANILSASTREIGVGYWAGGSYRHYWVQDFGRRSSVYPVVINREYARTSSPEVELYIYGQGVWTEMRLRNDDGNWSEWRPFQSSLNWRLNRVKGIRTVTVELRNGSDTTSSWDTIELTTSAPVLEVQPASLTFFYETSTRRLIPPAASISIQNSGNDQVLNWVVENINGDWFSPSAWAGSTPANLVINPVPNGGSFVQNQILSGSLTIRATDSFPVAGSPRQVAVQVLVVERVQQVFLPMVRR